MAERRHRQVVDMGLTLLAQASLPLEFWSAAFSHAVHVINRLPTYVLQGVSLICVFLVTHAFFTCGHIINTSCSLGPSVVLFLVLSRIIKAISVLMTMVVFLCLDMLSLMRLSSHFSKTVLLKL